MTSATSILATAPPEPTGTVDITVTTGPTSAPSPPADQFTVHAQRRDRELWSLSACTRLTGASDPAGIAAYAQATGTDPTLAIDYVDKSDGWAGMDSAGDMTAWTGSGYRLVIGVPILPGRGTLAQGATGAYDQYFSTLGQNLVSDDEAVTPSCVWGGSSTAPGSRGPWPPPPTPRTSWPSGARSSPPCGPCPARTSSSCGTPTPRAPPPTAPTGLSRQRLRRLRGDRRLRQLLGNALHPGRGLGAPADPAVGTDWLAAFAAEHDKPIAIPEWSDEYRTDGHGLGDDPTFIDNMAHWFVNNQVAFANVFSYDSSATYRNDLLDGTFPKALAEFEKVFGGGT